MKLLKIVMSGPAGVGKTALIRTATGETYDPSLQSTIAVDFKIFDIFTDRGTCVKCQIWDTAGQERFFAVTKKYYRGAHIILFVYDVGDTESFSKMTDYFQNAEWLKASGEDEYRSALYEHTCAYLIANKCDYQENDRTVDTETGRALAKEFNLIYGETSAKTGHNVWKIFQEAASVMEEYDYKLGKVNDTIFTLPERREVISIDSPEETNVQKHSKCC
jgi:small GTP-binding protein